MSEKSNLQQDLVLPDFPGSPLKAWKHYAILRRIDDQIREKLYSLDYPGYSLGLRVGYTIVEDSGEPQTFSMAFGYVLPEIKFKAEEAKVENDRGVYDQKNPLTDDYIDELYAEIEQLIAANITTNRKFHVSLEAVVSGSECYAGRACRMARVRECSGGEGKGQLRILRQRCNGDWYCTHNKC